MTQIAVVGAGIAGLNAALTLQDAGLSCTIYEASNRIGGRMHSDAMTWADGMISEWCGEFIDRNTMVQLACFSKLFHHCSILLEVRAGKHLRSQGLGYVKGIAIALCLIQSRSGVSLLRRVTRSLPCLRRFQVPSFLSMIPIPLCMPMRAHRSSPVTLIFSAATPAGAWGNTPTSAATRACARDPFTLRANIARSSSRALWKAQPERARGPLGRLCRMWREGDKESRDATGASP